MSSKPDPAEEAQVTYLSVTRDQVRKVKRGLRSAWNGVNAINRQSTELFRCVQELEARIRDLELSRDRIEDHLEDQDGYERE